MLMLMLMLQKHLIFRRKSNLRKCWLCWRL